MQLQIYKKMDYKDNDAVISAYITAVGDKQFDKLENLLAENFRFEGPFMNFDSAPPFIGALNRLGSILERNEIREIICNGADNCVLYDLVFINGGGYIPCMEWVNMSDGKITSIKLLFDKERFVSIREAVLNG